MAYFDVFAFYLLCPHFPMLSQNKITVTVTNLFPPPAVSQGPNSVVVTLHMLPSLSTYTVCECVRM